MTTDQFHFMSGPNGFICIWILKCDAVFLSLISTVTILSHKIIWVFRFFEWLCVCVSLVVDDAHNVVMRCHIDIFEASILKHHRSLSSASALSDNYIFILSTIKLVFILLIMCVLAFWVRSRSHSVFMFKKGKYTKIDTYAFRVIGDCKCTRWKLSLHSVSKVRLFSTFDSAVANN